MGQVRVTLPQVLIGLVAVALLCNVTVFYCLDVLIVGKVLEPQHCRAVEGKGQFEDMSQILDDYEWSRFLPKYALYAYIPEGQIVPSVTCDQYH
jgi:hypothetical protein